MRILPAWLREFVDIAADDRQLAEDLTSAGIAVESVEEEHGATFYEMDLTTNRVDAMNHYGVAREASAISATVALQKRRRAASLAPASERWRRAAEVSFPSSSRMRRAVRDTPRAWCATLRSARRRSE